MRHGEPNHTCRICGKPYFACDTCDAKIGKTWRAVTCTAEHYTVYLALWRYTYGQISEDEIKEVLETAEANKWTDSPSYEAIVALIGYPEEEEDEEAEEAKGAEEERDATLNVAYAPDDVIKREVKKEEAPEEEPVCEHEAVNDEKYEEKLEEEPVKESAPEKVKQNYSNGNNRGKVGSAKKKSSTTVNRYVSKRHR